MAGAVEGLVVQMAGGLAGIAHVALNQGYWFVPVAADLKEAPLCTESSLRGCVELTESTVELLEDISQGQPALYFHFEFHGGTGFQAAAGWKDGVVDFGPVLTANHETERQTEDYILETETADAAINRCLRWLGVERRTARDEFEALGLDRYRWTDQWLQHDDFPCLVCGGMVFNEPTGSYAICPICGWEDDAVQARHPRMRGGANGGSIADYQNGRESWSFASFERDAGWRPLHTDEAPLHSDDEGVVDYQLDYFAGRPPYYWRL
jgi:hypothetical protein